MKAFAILACACALATPALAIDYRYDLSMPYYDGTVDNIGYIVTNCDSCVLTSKSIVSWSMTQTNPAMGEGFSGAPFASSSMAGSSVLVQGKGFVATPGALSFDFNPGHSFADVMFSGGGNGVHYTNTPDFLSVYAGLMEDCSKRAGVCAGSTFSGNETVGRRSGGGTMAAPEVPASGLATALTMLLGALAIVTGRRPALRVRR